MGCQCLVCQLEPVLHALQTRRKESLPGSHLVRQHRPRLGGHLSCTYPPTIHIFLLPLCFMCPLQRSLQGCRDGRDRVSFPGYTIARGMIIKHKRDVFPCLSIFSLSLSLYLGAINRRMTRPPFVPVRLPCAADRKRKKER